MENPANPLSMPTHSTPHTLVRFTDTSPIPRSFYLSSLYSTSTQEYIKSLKKKKLYTPHIKCFRAFTISHNLLFTTHPQTNKNSSSDNKFQLIKITMTEKLSLGENFLNTWEYWHSLRVNSHQILSSFVYELCQNQVMQHNQNRKNSHFYEIKSFGEQKKSWINPVIAV